jgi:DNA modification methylase
MGSGTTIQASINTNRKYIGIEKDKDIYETAEKRIKKE